MYKIGIVGAKNSGKTTLIEKMIKELSKKSINVMSIKHTPHQHSFDTEGKDSFRHRKSGAKLTITENPSEFAIFSQSDKIIRSKLENIFNESFDICIVEGDKFSDLPKILLTRNIDKIDSNNISNILATYGESKIDTINLHFHLDDLIPLCSFIIEQASSISLSRRTQ